MEFESLVSRLGLSSRAFELEYLVSALGLSSAPVKGPVITRQYRRTRCIPDSEGTATAASSFNLENENQAAVGRQKLTEGSGWEGIKSVCVIGTYYENLSRDEELGLKKEPYRGAGVRKLASWVRIYLPRGSADKEEEEEEGLEKATQQAGPYEELNQTTGKVDPCLAVPFMEAKLDRRMCSFVASSGGSLVYCLGGSCVSGRWLGFPVNTVNVLCLQNKTLTSGPAMIHERVGLVALAVDEKIFAFGGVYLGDGDDPVDGVDPANAWAEFLDTSAEEPMWESMDAPASSKLLWNFGITAAIVIEDGANLFFGTEVKKKDKGGDTAASYSTGGKTILVIGETWTPWGDIGERVCFLFCIQNGTWLPIPPECIPQCCTGNPVVAAGHTLYWVCEYFYAYDLCSHKTYATDGTVHGLNNYRKISGENVSYEFKNLHHLGGCDFCLTWCESTSYFLGVIHSSVIRVELHEDFSPLSGHHRLDATVVSSQFYPVPPGCDFDFNFSLLLDKISSARENLEDVGEEKVTEIAWSV